jgi:aspartate kinase
MRVYKFGGASIKDADGFRNVCRILQKETSNDLILVISALGKTTNALEAITQAYFNRSGRASELLNEIRDQHFSIMRQLIPDASHPVFKLLNNTFVEIDWIIEDEPAESYDYIYDQIVSIGELASTRMAAAYFNYCGLKVKWIDAREWIKTDNTYREAKIKWQETEHGINKDLQQQHEIFLTQGFIGCTSENFTTTLGREGSDYTAAIIAYCTNAHSVTIWKDVPGVLNADPRYFDHAQLIPELSYHEAIEMTYYGATVIHPKTIKPLQNKNIPLNVRSFINDTLSGTIICDTIQQNTLPAIWVKKLNQTLISISAKDFSFIAEDNMSEIFKALFECGLKVNLMQNSALSFSLCVDNDEFKIKRLTDLLQKLFKVKTNDSLQLVTVRHYQQQDLDTFLSDKKIFLEQRSRNTAQVIYS